MALWDKYEYRPGLTFGSKMTAEQVVIRGRKDIFAQDGTKIDEVPEMLAEFGVHGTEQTYEYKDESGHGTGETHVVPNIHGKYFNLDEAAEEKGWTDEERTFAAKRLLWVCDKYPGDVWLHSIAAVVTPWPTYDKTHHSKIASLAADLGLLAEALAYEEQNKKRKSVVDDLIARIAAAQAVPVEVDDELLTAA